MLLSGSQFFVQYFRWHYGRGFNEFLEICRDFLRFITHFFSFKLLFTTLFSPWKRMGEHYRSGLHIEDALSTLLINMIMRAVGFFSRIIVLTIGLLVSILFILLSFASLIVWLLIPLTLLSLLIAAFFLIFASI